MPRKGKKTTGNLWDKFLSNIINRFSEDIDIAINRKVFGQGPPHGAEDAESNSQRKLRLIELETKSAAFITEELLPQLQQKMSEQLSPDEFVLRLVRKGNEVNIEFEYPGTLKDELGGLLPVVLIELVPRADELPNEDKRVTSIIYEVFPELLGEGSFLVSTLTPERTFLEKLLFIHETLEGFNKGSERKSRHFYDLFKLYHSGVFERIKLNRDLLIKVVEHRQTFFRYNTLDYNAILERGVSVSPSEERLPDWRSDYSRTAVMIYNKVPTFDELMDFAQRFEKEFNEWVQEK